MTGLQHPLVQDYLASLDRAGAGLPPEIRAELVADLAAHLDSALGPTSTDADVRNALQELGAPEDVAAAAYDGLGPAATATQTAGAPYGAPMSAPGATPVAAAGPWGPVEIIAVVGLTAGTFLVPFVGPLVGIVMAWVSERWTKREKIIATVLCLAPVLVLAIGGIGLVAMSGVSSSSGGSPVPAGPLPTLSYASGGTP
ncbi:MAG: hypothetical protein M3P23_16755 [Actinomycetota bacterium]|nr:hypothetical protein [Actinomycetota bacterium]